MILLIHAHPDPKSYTSALAAAIGESLMNVDIDVSVTDLYRIPDPASGGSVKPFPPVLELEELRRKSSLDESVLEQMKLVEQASAYVVIHPDWWGGAPAVLKGWIDRVLRPETAYEVPEGFGQREAEGLLSGRRAVVVITGDGDHPGPLEEFWKERVWAYCGVEAAIHYLPGIRQSSKLTRDRFTSDMVETVPRYLSNRDN